MFKILSRFQKCKKKSWEKVFLFRDDCIWICCVKLSLLRREYFWATVNVLKNSPKILPITKRDFFVKVVSFRFQHYLIPFPICLSKGLLKCNFLDIYLTTFFGIRNLRNTSVMRVILFFKVFKILSTFQNCKKRLRKRFFFFLDNCIWIGCLTLSLLRRENLPPTVNMFTNSPKILYIPKRDFLQLNCLHSHQ